MEGYVLLNVCKIISQIFKICVKISNFTQLSLMYPNTEGDLHFVVIL